MKNNSNLADSFSCGLPLDIASTMSQNLQAVSMEKTTNSNKLALALICLDKAANLLDNMKDFKSAERITRVIEKLATLK